MARAPTELASRRPVLRMRGIGRTYWRGRLAVPALRGVDLTVTPGDWVAIIGPSGSGKSTLLNILGLLDRPDAGGYELAGHDTAALGDNHRAELRNHAIGFIFQQFNLLARTSAVENVAAPLLYRGVRRSERLRQAMEALDAVGMADRAEHDPGELSGGQVQRVAIARALVTEPMLLLADEPTGNLDSTASADVMALFERLHDQGRTIVMITHEPGIAARAGQRLVLADGRLAPIEGEVLA
jgi:putative ABC transport system ATP-binding protein